MTPATEHTEPLSINPPRHWLSYYEEGQDRTEARLATERIPETEIQALTIPVINDDLTLSYAPSWLRAALAGNPNLDAAILHTLANTNDGGVLARILIHPNLKRATLQLIAENKNAPHIAAHAQRMLSRHTT